MYRGIAAWWNPQKPENPNPIQSNWPLQSFNLFPHILTVSFVFLGYFFILPLLYVWLLKLIWKFNSESCFLYSIGARETMNHLDQFLPVGDSLRILDRTDIIRLCSLWFPGWLIYGLSMILLSRFNKWKRRELGAGIHLAIGDPRIDQNLINSLCVSS